MTDIQKQQLKALMRVLGWAVGIVAIVCLCVYALALMVGLALMSVPLKEIFNTRE